MAQYLLLDKDRKAVNVMEWDGVTEFIMPEGSVGFVLYEGPYIPNATWNGSELVEQPQTEQ